MIRVTVDSATLGRLRGLHEPLELCDESGRVLGTFTPAAGAPSGGAAAGAGRGREAAADPGPELNVYGRESDLD
ncbi:MAG: hypothetical protein JO252_05545 [Planctomycetaceae bacterium]|nr:hypothetical protein [Planctomycetaceae bacterium]